MSTLLVVNPPDVDQIETLLYAVEDALEICADVGRRDHLTYWSEVLQLELADALEDDLAA